MKFQLSERGLVAILTVASCTALIFAGKDTVVGYSLLAVVMGYFGIEVFPIPQIRQKRRTDKWEKDTRSRE